MQGSIIGEHVLMMLILTKMVIVYVCYNCVTLPGICDENLSKYISYDKSLIIRNDYAIKPIVSKSDRIESSSSKIDKVLI